MKREELATEVVLSIACCGIQCAVSQMHGHKYEVKLMFSCRTACSH